MVPREDSYGRIISGQQYSVRMKGAILSSPHDQFVLGNRIGWSEQIMPSTIIALCNKPKKTVDAEDASGSNTQCGRVVRSRPASHSAAVTYKTNAPRNDGDTGVVSAAGTPMPNSVRELMSDRRGRALAR